MNIRFNLKFKVAFFFVLLVIIMMATVTYIFTIRELKLRREKETVRIERLAENIATIRAVGTEDWDLYQTVINNQLTLNPDIVYIAIFNVEGELKAHALKNEWIDLGYRTEITQWEEANIVWRLVQRQITQESQRDLESKSVNIIIGGENVGIVNVGFSLIDLNDEMRKNLYRNLRLGIIFVVIALLISLLMSYRVVTPLGKLTTAMRNISKGELDQSVHINSQDEIGQMARTFNFMAKGLQEKAVIERFSKDLGFIVELEKIAKLVTQRISLALNAKRAFLFLLDNTGNDNFELICAHPKASHIEARLHVNETLQRFLLSIEKPTPRETLKKFPEFLNDIEVILGKDTHRLLHPMVFKKKVIGIFLLDGNKTSISYTSEEQAFLGTLVGQSGFAIENALLLEDLTKRERFQREIEIAGMVQNGLLPQEKPEYKGLDIDGICIPAAEVGGDYYDFFQLDKSTFGITIADVTGKGSSAAFYMAVVKGMMLSLTSIYLSPKQLLRELNKRLYGRVDRQIFITMTYAVIDMKKRTLTFSRAGHNALIVRKQEDASVKFFNPDGIGLGLEKGELFNRTISESKMSLSKGDVFLFYTDGVNEAMNHRKEEFGDERLMKVISEEKAQNSEEMRKKIIKAVNTFTESTPQHDDITLVTITVT